MAGKSIYRFSDVEVDPSRGCVRRQGQEHYPRSKVFQVLLYLLEHRDRLVAKQELIEQLWKDAAVTDDVVFHCIADIRTLLGDSRESARFVRTFPAAGYRFVAEVEGERSEPLSPNPQPPTPNPLFRRLLLPATLLLVLAMGTWLGVGRPWRAPPPPESEAAWWRFDEGSGTRARDSSGYGNDGTLAGSPHWIDGKLGKALEFEGIHSHVAGNRPARSLPQGNEPRSVTAWIRTSSTNGDLTNILHYGAPLPASFMFCLRDDGRLSAGRPGDEVQGTSRLDDGAWHFVAASYEGPGTGILRLFVDGLQETARKLRLPLDTASGPWSIGRFVDSGTPFRGAIDDVRVYAQPLSAPWLMALYRCGGAHPLYYLPVFPSADIGVGSSGELRNDGTELGGVQLARSDGVCSIDSLRGADLGQDLHISADLLVPPQPPGQLVTAGPYFRSRAAAPGDGIIGGASAGYWVQLYSTGAVKVRRLNLHQIVAFSAPPSEFDPSRFHKLEITARGSELQVALDGSVVEFDQGGRMVRTVAIPSSWDGPPRIGYDRGTAGIAFGAEPRGAGGQQARNITITPLR